MLSIKKELGIVQGKRKKLIFDQYINEVESNEYCQKRENINEENDFKITDLFLNTKKIKIKIINNKNQNKWMDDITETVLYGQESDKYDQL